MMGRSLRIWRPRLARIAALGLCVLAAGCAGSTSKTPPPVKTPAPLAVLSDPHAIAAAQHALTALGYDAGRADGRIGPHTEMALRAYQKDEKIPSDGRLTAPLAERLATASAKLPGKSWIPEPGVTVIYNEGPAETLRRRQGSALIWQTSAGTRLQRPSNFLLSGNAAADTPPYFLQPLRPGRKGQYRVTAGDKSGVVSCVVGRLGRLAVPAGSFDVVEATCREEIQGQPPVERRFSYAPALRLVIRKETRIEGQEPRIRELVAVRPAMETWPQAAQEGFDWAISHALEDAAAEDPVLWSSTAVKGRFAIHVDRTQPMILPSRASGSGLCLRFEVTRTDMAHSPYPGLACKSDKGPWVIPSSAAVEIARPPKAAATGPGTLVR